MDDVVEALWHEDWFIVSLLRWLVDRDGRQRVGQWIWTGMLLL